MNLKIRVESGIKQVLMMTYQSSSIAVEITKLINKRELSNADKSFDILIRYLEFTGKFDVYYNNIVAIYEDIIMMTDAEITNDLNEVLDLFDNESIEKFLDSEKYQSPSNLIDEFHDDIIKNREGSREQTYTKRDYRDLVVTAIKFKAISIILARFVAIHNLNVNSAEAVKLFRIVRNMSNVNQLPGFIKLIDYINMNIAGDESVTQEDIARILNKSITNNQFAQYITLNVIIYIGVANSPDLDTPVRCLVNEIFRLCRNKTASTSNIIINDPSISIDDEGGSSSVTDTYLSLTRVPIGTVEEFLICFETMDLLLAQNKIPIDMKYIEEGMLLKNILIDKELTNIHQALICWCCVDMMESEYYDYFTKEIVNNLRVLVYAIMKTYGLNELANIMMGVPYETGGYLSKSAINTTTPELEESLSNMYGITVNKKSRNRRYGLTILDDVSDAYNETSIKELLIKPIIRKISTTRWLCYNLPKENNVISVNGIRAEIIKLMCIIHENM